MKSITIRDKFGKILIQIIHRKNGIVDMTTHSTLHGQIDIDVRDKNNKKLMFK